MVTFQTINTVSEVIRGFPANQEYFSQVNAPSNPPRYMYDTTSTLRLFEFLQMLCTCRSSVCIVNLHVNPRIVITFFCTYCSPTMLDCNNMLVISSICNPPDITDLNMLHCQLKELFLRIFFSFSVLPL